ncbi:hypothetical protein CXG81DRAFT_29055 [Caulochytrium protostelioides]|uniref:CDP-diacylglycerol--serine O-phosphatidyltransferase n=1 Tax=Caulochytrium protostelioides TaxID=1555241 RepID=A0A4P9XFF0_9FUNG|nr:hypothetical protein CXG81DRAFT_29055 [Caulochytrium protostelioides]|eukprot:RKP04315.1 hypothetical protein CXG81DRAFT_29055 [Caulochytrium protostelioides]
MTSKSTAAQPAVAYRHFNMIRDFTLADFVTLCNAASGFSSLLASLKFVTTQEYKWLQTAVLLLPLAFLFDVLDGHVARMSFRGTSPMGQELDSLADIISFGCAPAVLGFAVGMQGLWDLIILCYFVCCGVSRLARYNVYASGIAEKDARGKIRYFEGTPIPMTILIAMWLLYLSVDGRIGQETLLFGKYIFFGWTFHPAVLVYALSGTLMISRTIRIPKL